MVYRGDLADQAVDGANAHARPVPACTRREYSARGVGMSQNQDSAIPDCRRSLARVSGTLVRLSAPGRSLDQHQWAVGSKQGGNAAVAQGPVAPGVIEMRP